MTITKRPPVTSKLQYGLLRERNNGSPRPRHEAECLDTTNSTGPVGAEQGYLRRMRDYQFSDKACLLSSAAGGLLEACSDTNSLDGSIGQRYW